MAIPSLPPPTGDAKNPPNSPPGWGKLFDWFYLLWKWVTITLPGSILTLEQGLTFGNDPFTYSAAIFSTAQTDGGPLLFIGGDNPFGPASLSTFISNMETS
jgi:hypothetical protein